MRDLLRDALGSVRVVLSVMGAHAGEDEGAIFSRKIADVSSTGKTFWVYGAHGARPGLVQNFGAKYVLFLAPSSRNGARPTTTSAHATEFSLNKSAWFPLPEKLSPVTGRMPGYAFVFSRLLLCSDAEIDLWSYAGESCDAGTIRFKLGASTVLARRKDTSWDSGRMLSRFRRVVAVGELEGPGAVWLR
jgi:hypothetical protein